MFYLKFGENGKLTSMFTVFGSSDEQFHVIDLIWVRVNNSITLRHHFTLFTV